MLFSESIVYRLVGPTRILKIDDRRRAHISGRGDMFMLIVGCCAWFAVFLIAIELFWLRYG